MHLLQVIELVFEMLYAYLLQTAMDVMLLLISMISYPKMCQPTRLYMKQDM